MNADALRNAGVPVSDPPLSPQDEDWLRFCAVETMVSHWDRPGWWPGREAYYWYLTFDSRELRNVVAECQEHLRMPCLDPVSLNGLHLTLPKVGWTDEVAVTEAHQVAARARERLAGFGAFELTAGPLAGSAGAVRLSVAPWAPVLRLASTLHPSGPEETGTNSPISTFRPHIGVAYCNETIASERLQKAVAELRALTPVTLEVDSVHLVVLRRTGRRYDWQTLQSIALSA